MKKTHIIIAILLLIAAIVGIQAMVAADKANMERANQEREQREKLNALFSDNIPYHYKGLFDQWAKETPTEEEFAAARAYADEKGEAESFDRYCGILSATKALLLQKPGMETYLQDYSFDDSSSPNQAAVSWAALENELLMALCAQPGRQEAAIPVLWTAQEFRKAWGAEMLFEPQNPMENKCLLLMNDDNQIGVDGEGIDSAYNLSSRALTRQAEEIARSILKASENQLSFTGDPNQASIALFYSVTYPSGSKYGPSGATQGYDCNILITAYDLKTRASIDTAFLFNYLGNTVTVSNGGASSVWPGLSETLSKGTENLALFAKALSTYWEDPVTFAEANKDWRESSAGKSYYVPPRTIFTLTGARCVLSTASWEYFRDEASILQQGYLLSFSYAIDQGFGEDVLDVLPFEMILRVGTLDIQGEQATLLDDEKQLGLNSEALTYSVLFPWPEDVETTTEATLVLGEQIDKL